MSRSLVSRFCFSFIGFWLLLLFCAACCSPPGFYSHSDELSLMQARCRLGFERRVDAAISRTALKTKVGSQSSEHGVIATGKHHHLRRPVVERHVRFLCHPEAMEQDSKLAGNRNDGLTWPACRLGLRDAVPTVEALSLSHVVAGCGSRTRSADFGDRRSRLGDAELRISLARLAAFWS